MKKKSAPIAKPRKHSRAPKSERQVKPARGRGRKVAVRSARPRAPAATPAAAATGSDPIPGISPALSGQFTKLGSRWADLVNAAG